MWDSIHSFLYAIRYPVLLLSLVGVIYAIFLFIRAFQALAAQGAPESRARRKLQRKFQAQSSVQPAATGAAPPVDEEAQQANLLNTLPDDSIPEAEGGGTAAVAEEEPPAAEAPVADRPAEPPSTHPLTALHKQGGDDDQQTSYGIDSKARTRFDLERTPVANDGMTPEDREDKGSTVLPDSRKRTDVQPPEESAVAEEAETPAAEEAVPQPATRPSTEAIRRAGDMEKRGFHIGIEPDDHEHDPRNVTDAEKAELLGRLGLSEQDDGEGTERMRTTELDDILSRLDRALSTTFDTDDGEAPTDAKGDAAVADDDGRSGSADDSTTKLNQPVVTEDQGIQDDTTVEAEPQSESTVDEHEVQTQKLDHGDPQPGAGPAGTIRRYLEQQEESGGGSTDELPEEDADDVGQTEPEPQDRVDTTGPQRDETAAADRRATEAPPASDGTKPPSDPDRAIDNVPDWARADTFDDDKPDDLGEQTDLFKNGG